MIALKRILKNNTLYLNLKFTKIASKSYVFRERFALVDTPSEYYTIISFLD